MKRATAGFTLIELMIVVVIVGILSAIAIPTFRTYALRSKTTEATTFLGEIKQRQESYRAEFGQYCAVSGTAFGTWTPRAMPDANLVAWTNPPSPMAWTQLGAAPDGPVRFVYATTAGPPGTGPGGIAPPDDFWFVSEAMGDLDGDGTTCLFESYSASNHIWLGPTTAIQNQGYE